MLRVFRIGLGGGGFGVGSREEDGVEEILRDLERLKRYGGELGRLLSELGRVMPERSQGTDRTGMVMAALGPSGLPEAIQVHSRWRERLPAGSFSAAVAEACQSAMRERGAAWAKALDAPAWKRRFDQLEPDRAGASPEPGRPELPAALLRGGSSGRPRESGALAEEAISLYDSTGSRAERTQAQLPPQGVGANPERTIALTVLAGGQVSCHANPRWVEQQTAPVINQALGQALTAARQNLARAQGDGAGPGGAAQARQLLEEIMTAFADQVRSSSSAI